MWGDFGWEARGPYICAAAFSQEVRNPLLQDAAGSPVLVSLRERLARFRGRLRFVGSGAFANERHGLSQAAMNIGLIHLHLLLHQPEAYVASCDAANKSDHEYDYGFNHA